VCPYIPIECGLRDEESDIDMKVELQLRGIKDKFMIHNIYPLYLHDLSEVWERKENRYGAFEEDNTRMLAEQNRVVQDAGRWHERTLFLKARRRSDRGEMLVFWFHSGCDVLSAGGEGR